MPQGQEHNYMDELLSKGSQSTLERRFIMEYLRNNGYQFEDLKKMPPRRWQKWNQGRSLEMKFADHLRVEQLFGWYCSSVEC